MIARIDRLGRRARLMAGGLAMLMLAGCASTIDIGRLLDEPQRYDGRTVQVEGTVTRSAGILGIGAYEMEDGTGSIFVVAQGQGVPREGARTKVKGTFRSVFSMMGNTVAAIVLDQRSDPDTSP